MLDLRRVVDDREAVERALAARGFSFLAAGVDPWALDAERRAALQRVEELRHGQRVCGEEIARRARAREDASGLKAEMKAVSGEIKSLETTLQSVEERLREALLGVPNLPDPSVPVGEGAEANVEVRRVGEPPVFDFAVRPHWEIGPALGI